MPIKDSAKKSARLIKGAKEIYYPGRPHGLTATHQDEVNADLLKFLKSLQQVRNTPEDRWEGSPLNQDIKTNSDKYGGYYPVTVSIYRSQNDWALSKPLTEQAPNW